MKAERPKQREKGPKLGPLLHHSASAPGLAMTLDLPGSSPSLLRAWTKETVFYMAYNGDLFRYYIRNYWDEVGTKFDDCGTKFVEISTNYNPEVIKYRP